VHGTFFVEYRIAKVHMCGLTMDAPSNLNPPGGNELKIEK
jgi:hypothetical protein